MELQKYGHRVRLATHEVYRAFVEGFALEFFPLGGDPTVLSEYVVRNRGENGLHMQWACGAFIQATGACLCNLGCTSERHKTLVDVSTNQQLVIFQGQDCCRAHQAAGRVLQLFCYMKIGL